MVCKFNYENHDQKELYFRIQNIINLENKSSHTYAGIYVIFKDKRCVYVGQSKNIASRLATHIKGKYANADMMCAYDVRDMGWSDFHERNSSSRQAILDNAEKSIIAELKPTENIIADFDYCPDEDSTPSFYIDNCTFSVDTRDADMFYLTVTSSDLYEIVTTDDIIPTIYHNIDKKTRSYKSVKDILNRVNNIVESSSPYIYVAKCTGEE